MKITIKKYQNIIKMLQSSDEENHTIALGIIDTLDFEDNVTKILLMMKHGSAGIKTWGEHAPAAHKKITDLHTKGVIGDINRHLTYKQVLSAITKLKVDPKEFEFYMTDFSDYLLKQVKSMGYDFIESMEIKMKYKNHDEQSGDTGQGE